MAKLRVGLSVSLDGFIAGPNPSEQDPLGEGGMALHDRGRRWRAPTSYWSRAAITR